MKKIIIIGIIVIVLVISLGIFMSNKLDKEPEERLNEIELTEESIVDNCSGLNLVNTSNCLRRNIASFYQFKSTPDDLSLSFQEIVEQGGDCRDWSFLYERLGTKLGFNATTVKRQGIPEVMPSHRIAVLWDNNTYCKLNLINPIYCYEIKK